MSAIIVLDSSDDERICGEVPPLVQYYLVYIITIYGYEVMAGSEMPGYLVFKQSEATTVTSNMSPAAQSASTAVSPNTEHDISPSPGLNGHSNSSQKRLLTETPENESVPASKRIKPTLLSKTIDRSRFETESPTITFGNEDTPISLKETDDEAHESAEAPTLSVTEEETDENPITPTFAALLRECKKADTSADMNTLIEKKLLKYYHSVHPDFVSSRGFCKTVKAVSDEIKTAPEFVYYQLKTVVEELKIRRKSKSTVMSNEEMTSTGNERRDCQIRRLSKGLLVLTKRIEKLEECDVDLGDEDNSTFLQVERFKKHACKIYEKICDLTGESKHAHRSVKKPISFQGTCYIQFNKTIQAFVNRTNTFPDFFDVLRCLEHCNVQYGFGLRTDDVKKIAQDAFLKIGKSLQNRRQTDLYETVSHFTGTSPDPAQADQTLNAKLTENQKFHAKIGTIIDRYAEEQELAAADHKEKQNTSGNCVNTDCSVQQIELQSSRNGVVIEDLINCNEGNHDEESPAEIKNEESNPLRRQKGDATKSSIKVDHVEEIVISDEEDS